MHSIYGRARCADSAFRHIARRNRPASKRPHRLKRAGAASAPAYGSAWPSACVAYAPELESGTADCRARSKQFAGGVSASAKKPPEGRLVRSEIVSGAGEVTGTLDPLLGKQKALRRSESGTRRGIAAGHNLPSSYGAQRSYAAQLRLSGFSSRSRRTADPYLS